MKYSFKDIVIDSRTGLNPRKNFVLGSGNNAYITIKDIYGGKINISEKTDRVDDEAIQIIKKRSRISVGDVLFVSIGRIGETAIVYEKDDSWDVNESIFIFTINKNLIIPEYFCLLFESEDVRNSLLKNSSGSTFKSIKMGQLEKMEFDIPSLQEQRTIVDRIHKNKAIIALRKAELQKLDELVKARFVEMFGDPVTNEKGWKTKPLLELGSCKNGMNFHYDDCGIEINCLGVGDFKDHSVITNTEDLPTVSLNEMPSEEYLLKDDDIVFVRSNGNKALVGRSVAVYPADTPTTFSGFCIRFRKTDDTVLVPYLLRVLKADSIRAKMAGRGANIQNLNQQILGSLVIPVPPTDLQAQFVSFAKQLDKSKVVVQKALNEAQLLFDSLMQQYFG
jgi:type I restriction enzyme S subunit